MEEVKDNLVNTVKHLIVLDPSKIDKVNIIGCGALGSKVALEVAKLGAKDIHLWDFDTLESHNIANQGYPYCDVGKPKVDALKNLIEFFTGLKCDIHNQKVDKDTKLTGIVFLCTDSMTSRKEIYENCLKMNSSVPFFIDTRMGVSVYNIITVVPISILQTEKYEKEALFNDEDVSPEQTRACAVTPSIGATSSMCAAHAVWQFIKTINVVKGPTEFMGKVVIERDVFVGLTDRSSVYSKVYKEEKKDEMAGVW